MFISSFFNFEHINIEDAEFISYLDSNVERILLPSVMIETKKIFHTNPPTQVACGLRYSPFYIDLKILDFDANILRDKKNKENISFKINIYNHDGISESFNKADHFSINIYNCNLVEQNISDFSHRSNEIQKISLIYEPSYIGFSYIPKL